MSQLRTSQKPDEWIGITTFRLNLPVRGRSRADLNWCVSSLKRVGSQLVSEKKVQHYSAPKQRYRLKKGADAATILIVPSAFIFSRVARHRVDWPAALGMIGAHII